jgi:uncharacterized membrane protein
MDAAVETATWWSYADADQTALAVIVVMVGLAAAAYVGRRIAGVVRERKRR